MKQDAFTKLVTGQFEFMRLALENVDRQQRELMTALREALQLIESKPANYAGLGRIKDAVERCGAAKKDLRELLSSGSE